jgi:peptide chain release factor 2
LNSKEIQIKNLEFEISKPSFWSNKDQAKKIIGQLTYLKNMCAMCNRMYMHIKDLIALKELAIFENDENLLKDVGNCSKKLEKELLDFVITKSSDGELDKNNAIMSIHAGAGGTESCDWAQMLLRMYSKWSGNKGFKMEVIDSLYGDETGIKSTTVILKGEYAFKLLQSEIGVHRLIRVSPFDSNKRRHTSFSSVDVIPEVDDDTTDLIIKDRDVRIDTYRSSGAGGQHVNKTDSAVRITHLTTGLVVQSQNERSQIKNKSIAMKLLKAKLYELEQKKQRISSEKHYDEKGAIEWGSQIRSYVFMPYQLVKDHRTSYETSYIDLVMNGGIDDFISSYLYWKLNKK